jgi:DNA primase small subunit
MEVDDEPMKDNNKVMTSNGAPCHPEQLQMYYSRLFPYELLEQWLSQDYSRREFAFTIEPVPGEEIWIRYQSFRAGELRPAILAKRAIKLDIGAVFSHPPKDHNTTRQFSPVQRELVFDIDLTDYDTIRYCGCAGTKNICRICWSYIVMAMQVVDTTLRTDFGYQHLAWVFSGRRGVHCWVCDESARQLTDEARSAIASYFDVRFV